MAKATEMRFLDVWYTRFDADKVIAEITARSDKAAVKSAKKLLAKAQKGRAWARWTSSRSGSTAATGSSSCHR